MSNPLTKTVRILRPARVRTDERGRTVWDGPVEETELELVSTTMLRAMLDSGDDRHRRELREAAAGKDGLLARNLKSGTFEIIDDEDLKAALATADATPAQTRAADVTADVNHESLRLLHDGAGEELSLVSTQALRRMLGRPAKAGNPVADEAQKPGKAKPKLPGGGFDPYNSA